MRGRTLVGLAIAVAAANESAGPIPPGVPETPRPPARPEWIWTDAAEAARTATLRARFGVSDPQRRVRLKCAADFCRVEVRVNDGPGLTIEYGAPRVEQDVTASVRRGRGALRRRRLNHPPSAPVAHRRR